MFSSFKKNCCDVYVWMIITWVHSVTRSCLHVHTRTHTYTHARACTHTRTHTHTHTHIYTRACTYARTHTHTHTHIHVHVKIVPLMEHGAEIEVTDRNKVQYLNLLAQYRLSKCVKEEIESFLKGWSLVVINKWEVDHWCLLSMARSCTLYTGLGWE